jgi:hypothetical protein
MHHSTYCMSLETSSDIKISRVKMFKKRSIVIRYAMRIIGIVFIQQWATSRTKDQSNVYVTRRIPLFKVSISILRTCAPFRYHDVHSNNLIDIGVEVIEVLHRNLMSWRWCSRDFNHSGRHNLNPSRCHYSNHSGIRRRNHARSRSRLNRYHRRRSSDSCWSSQPNLPVLFSYSIPGKPAATATHTTSRIAIITLQIVVLNKRPIRVGGFARSCRIGRPGRFCGKGSFAICPLAAWASRNETSSKASVFIIEPGRV